MTNEVKQKVFLVEVMNDDYQSFITRVFSTYVLATQWLLDDGYIPYHKYPSDQTEELRFYWEDEWDSCIAKIIEMEIEA